MAKKKFKLKQNHMLIAMVALMVVSLIPNLNFNQKEDTPIQNNENEITYEGDWMGLKIYKKLTQDTELNTSIYYLNLGNGYQMVLRADPREAALVESPLGSEIYSLLYSSTRVYLLFDPEDSNNVSIAYAELARYISGRPFEIVFATTSEFKDEFNRTMPYVDPFNVTSNEASIYLKIVNETKITRENRTLIISGEEMWSLTTAAAKIQMILMRLI